MAFEDTKILKFNQGERSDKAAFIIYPDLDCLERTDVCKNNHESSSIIQASAMDKDSFSLKNLRTRSTERSPSKTIWSNRGWGRNIARSKRQDKYYDK